MASRNSEGDRLSAVIPVYIDPELKRQAGEKADELGLPLSEYVATLVGKDLGWDGPVVPRKPSGRPRNDIPRSNGRKKVPA